MASGIEPDLGEWSPLSITEATMDLFILSSSKGLAEMTRADTSAYQTVQFIHESVPDYLIKDKGLLDLWPDLGEDFESLSHDRLKTMLPDLSPSRYFEMAAIC